MRLRMIRPMALDLVGNLGDWATSVLAALGSFFIFVWQTVQWMLTASIWRKLFRLVLPQFYEVGVRSVPVIAITGCFIGMVMAIETVTQFKAIGQEYRIGTIINLSVVKQIGPVLAAVMLAGRVGGALTAELATMNVTEQLDALRVMGVDPIRYLVVPRFIACVLLTPVLTIYSDFLGVLGGWFISVFFLRIPNGPYWSYSTQSIDTWQVMEGIIKSVFFGGSIGMIACYKGFNSRPGAIGVGRACTESFVSCFIVIIILNFFFAQVLKTMYVTLYGIRGIF